MSCDDKIERPYLNADVYKAYEEPSKIYRNLEFIDIYSDGSTLLGAADLTGRYWDGMFQVTQSAEQLVSENRSYIPLFKTESGASNGCFLSDPSKVLIAEDRGAISVWANESSWSNVAGKDQPSWAMSCMAYEHDESVLGLDLFPNKELAVTGSADNCIKVWDLSNLMSLKTYRPAHSQMVSDVACSWISQDIFLSSGLDSSTALWDIRETDKKTKVFRVPSTCAARCVTWLSGTIFVVGYENGDIRIFDSQGFDDSLFLLKSQFPVHKMKYNKSSKLLAVCSDSNKLNVYKFVDNTTLQSVFEDSQHCEFVRGLCWDVEKTSDLYSCAWDNQVLKHSITT